MALPSNTINYASVYGELVDELISVGITSSILQTTPESIKWVNGKTFMIPKVDVGYPGDYDKINGYGGTSATLDWEPISLDMDRDFNFAVDVMDIDGSGGVLTTSQTVSQYFKQRQNPEVDAYNYSKAFDGIRKFGGQVVLSTPSANDILQKIMLDISKVRDEVGEETPLLLFLSGQANTLLTQYLAGKGTILTQNITTPNGLNLTVNVIDRVPVIVVPSNRMMTDFSFPNRTAGFTKKKYAGQLNWLILGADSYKQIIKRNETKFVGADINQRASADEVMGRLVYGGWMYENKANACLANIKEESVVASIALIGTGVPAFAGASGKAEVTLGDALGADGIKWYTKNTESKDAPAVPKLYSEFDSDGYTEVTVGTKVEVTSVSATHKVLLVGVKDGYVISQSAVAAS